MYKLKVYLETTIFNYYFDKTKNAQPATVAFFEAIDSGQFEGFTSVYAYDELNKAPEPQRTNMLNLIEKYHITVLDTSDEVIKLAETYIENNIIPKKKRVDALHLAIASAHEMDIILSFNFKHINKLKTKTLIPATNLLAGYRNIIITQPEEVIDYEIDD
ncbi:MAG: PIN domain-containing protein [Treponema sp.]|jgi:predicted nucleic acid-binding protein|nr:PIN domain-containing protein [Treponema sp.]